MRLIDWKRGNPYTWDYNDLTEILKSDRLFIRKIGNANELQKQLVNYLKEEMKYKN